MISIALICNCWMWNHAFRLTVHQSWHNFGGAAIVEGSPLFPDQIACHHLAIAGCVIFFLFYSSFWLLPLTVFYWVCNSKNLRLTTSLDSYFLVCWLPSSVSVSVDVWTLIFTRIYVHLRVLTFLTCWTSFWMLTNLGVWGCWRLCFQLLSTSAPEHSGKLSGILDVASNRWLRLSNHRFCVSWMFFQLTCSVLKIIMLFLSWEFITNVQRVVNNVIITPSSV